MILTDSGGIEKEHLLLPLRPPPSPPRDALKTRVETAERNAVLTVLDQVGGNRSKAAKLLGISRSSLYDRLRKYGL